MDCLIIATPIEDGLYYDWRGVQDGVRAIIPTAVNVEENNVERKAEIWACNERDVDAVMGTITNNFHGVEVKAFKLFKLAQRPAGPITIREVTKDGVLPF